MNTEKRRRYKLVGAFLALCFAFATQLATTCEEQDFWVFSPITVATTSGEPSAEVLFTKAEAFLCHPARVARHDLDYTLSNTSSTERSVAIIEAQSILGGTVDCGAPIVRGERRKVFDLDAGESVTGHISELDLKLGDGIQITLACCNASVCSPGEIACPASCGGFPTTFCLAACFDDNSPAIKRSGCANDQCLASCLDNYENCCPSPPAVNPCTVPCCTDGSTCLDFTCAPEALKCSDDGTLGCQGFLTRCVTGCGDTAVRQPSGCGQEQCVEACLSAFANLDSCCALSSSCDAPCCFDEACNAQLEGIVKLSPIECLDEASACSSEQICNDRGLCENKVREATSSCSVSPGQHSYPAPAPRLPTALLLIAGLVGLRRSLV